MCWEEWYNPLTETIGVGTARQLASSFGTIGNESHLHLSAAGEHGQRRSDCREALYGFGRRHDDDERMETMPQFNAPSTWTFTSTTGMSPGLYLTVPGVGVLRLVTTS